MSSWIKIGSTINGEDEYDNLGFSIDLSSDGNVLAVGAYGDDENGTASGQVRIYEYKNDEWNQVGNNINGENEISWSGYSISLSSNGDTVAIGGRLNNDAGTNAGHTRIFKYISNTWTQLGSDIDGDAQTVSGTSVSLSGDGSRVVIGAPGVNSAPHNRGKVRIFEYSSGSWTQLGGDINGEAEGDLSGRSVSISSDGTTVAIGAHGNDGNGLSSGHTRVFSYSGTSWNQLGNDINGEASEDYFGKSVSLSGDGTVLAVGATGNDGNGSAAGHVRVFKYTNDSWAQQGDDIEGEESGAQSGMSVDLSEDGTVVSIGSPHHDDGGTSSGKSRVFQFKNSTWNQLGQGIAGEGDSNRVGIGGSSVVKINNNVYQVVGAPGSNTFRGSARIFRFSLLTSTNNLFLDDLAPLIVGPNGSANTNSSMILSDGDTSIFRFQSTEPVEWSISKDEKSQFKIDEETGALAFRSIPEIGFYNVEINAKGQSGLSTKALKITVDRLGVIGTEKSEIFKGSKDPEIFDGGLGEDTVKLNGNFSDYLFNRSADSIKIYDERYRYVDGFDGDDILKNIEWIQFADQKVATNKLDVVRHFSSSFKNQKFYNRGNGIYEIETEQGYENISGIPILKFTDQKISAIADIKGVFDQITGLQTDSGEIFRLYNAAFARFPDSDGLSYWIHKYSSGENDSRSVASSFLISNEFKTLYGDNISASTYVNILYNNVLGRAADASGLNYWTGQLNHGLETRYEVLLGFSESAENKALFTNMTGFG